MMIGGSVKRNGTMNNTVTTKDISNTALRPKPAYDFFGNRWAIGAGSEGEDADPVGQFGVGAVRTSRRSEGFGDLAGPRTSRRAEGFGDLGLGFLDAQVMGIPVWALGLGAFVLLGGPAMLGIGKKKK
jgi:hypothetical protein